MVNTVGIVGLGKIAQFHVEALERIGDVEVIGGADIDTTRSLIFRGVERRIYGSVDELCALSPACVIVATPTKIHFETVQQVLSANTELSRLIVEKPLAMKLDQVEQIARYASAGLDIDVLYHAAHGPEVLWAGKRMGNWRRKYGEAVAWESYFSDPYASMEPERRANVYVNSWFDSGINALSVAARLVKLTEMDSVESVDDAKSEYIGRCRFRSGGKEGLGEFRTSWNVSEPTKKSTVYFETGARLDLDHQGIAGRLSYNGDRISEFIYEGTLPRLSLHYKNAFESLFVQRAGYYGLKETLALHRLLFAGGDT